MDNHINLIIGQADPNDTLGGNEYFQQQLEQALTKSGEGVDEEETCEVAIVRPWCISERSRTLSPRELEEKGKSLFDAAKYGRLEEIQQLLNDGAPHSYTEDLIKWTALHLVAEEGHVDAVSALISAGANVNARDTFGDTPLHIAASNDHRDVVSLLINSGASVNSKDNFGWTPLHNVACLGRPQCLQLLLAAGGDVNAIDKNGDTPLHSAACNCNEECVQLLIGGGADTTIRNDEGNTAKDIASGIAPFTEDLFP